MNHFSRLPSGPGLTQEEICALALVLKAKGTARSLGLNIADQHRDGQTLQIRILGPNMRLVQGSAKTSFEELLSLSEMTTFLPGENTLEITLRFSLVDLVKTSPQ